MAVWALSFMWPAISSQVEDGSLGSLIHVACHIFPSWAGGRHGIAFIVTVAMEIFWKPRTGKSLHDKTDFVLQTASNKYIESQKQFIGGTDYELFQCFVENNRCVNHYV